MKKILCLLLVFVVPVLSANVTAKAWVVADAQGNIIKSENTTQSRSIASITKLMTAMVVVDAHQDLSEKIGSYTRHQLIQLALVRSDNHAAVVLCENYPNGLHACIKAMNHRAYDLGMVSTKFVEPTGLSVMNISTADDLIKLVIAASEYSEVVQASRTPVISTKSQKKYMMYHNTNPLVAQDSSRFFVSKTGYIRRAGGCIVMMLDTLLGRRIVILLGSKDTHTRIPEALTLMLIR
jgi:D-alanyl-D-alanine carboxypeptidase